MRLLLRRLWYLIRRPQREADLLEEIEFHRAMKRRDLEEAGHRSDESASAVQRALGNDLSARAQARDVWIAPWIQDVYQDVRFAGRLLARDPAFATTAVLVLALGIGVNNLFVTLIYSHTLRGLPIDRPDRVLYVSTFDDRSTDRAVSYPDFEDLRRTVGSFSGLAAFANGPVVLGDEGRVPDRVEGAYVSANAFSVIGVHSIGGRPFTSDDDRAGAPRVVMLGSGVWQSRYGGDPGVVGRSIDVNGTPTTVVGIIPEKSGFPSVAEAWLPLSQMPGLAPERRDTPTLRVFGRLRDDAAEADARAEIESIIERAAQEHPNTSKNVRARVVPINQRYFGRLEGGWLAFTSAAFLIVAISSANVANLLLGRSVHRAREIAVRTSLGASRLRVVRQLVIEACVLAAVGGAAGLGLALAGVRLFESAVPAHLLPYWFDYSIDGRLLAGLAGIAIGTVFVFGLAPAWHASKTDVNRVLKNSGRTGLGRRATSRWTLAFLTIEFALTVVLVANVIFGFRTDSPDLPSDLAIATPSVVTAAITLPGDKYPTIAGRAEIYRRMEERLQMLPGVSSVALAGALPRRGAAEQRLEVTGHAHASGETRPAVWTVAVGPAYFDTLGLGLLRGRPFTDAGGATGERQAIVNQRFVEMFLANEDPLGQRVAVGREDPAPSAPEWLTIVGVAPDVRQRPSPRADPLVYLPFRTLAPSTAALLVRTGVDAAVTASDLRRAMLALDADLPLYRVATMADVIDEAEWTGRTSYRLIWLISAVALALATVGLYAVTAYAVAQRTQEIGLRMALGARSHQIRRMVLMRALVQVGVGLGAGIVCTIGWDRMFSSGGRVSVADPPVLAMVGVVLGVVTLVACVVPARRAMRLDPMVVLRDE